MPAVGRSARLKLEARNTDHSSPIEDQVTEVYEAARRLSKASGFTPHVHPGPHGPVKGHAGKMVMKSLIHQLYPDYPTDAFETAYSIIVQALRKTDAAVCIRQPVPSDKNDRPTWFIAEQMPENIVVVTTGIARKSAGQHPSNGFDESRYLTRQEKRLQDTEVERPVGEVVTTPPRKGVLPAAFEEKHRRRSRARERFDERLLEEIATQSVPCTVHELHQIVDEDEGADHHRSTYRDSVKRLLAAGKIVERKETIEEAVIRGGGSLPKAKRPNLYAVAPGPVPMRTRLPDGIKPVSPAKEIADAARDRKQADDEDLLDFFRTYKGGRGNLPPRSTGKIAEAIEWDEARVIDTLRRLERQGLVYENSSRCWYLSERRRGPYRTSREKSTLPSEEPEDTVPESAPVETQTSFVWEWESEPEPDPEPEPADNDDLQLVLNLAAKLGVELPTGGNAELEAENERLRAQVAALKAAIAILS